MPKLEATFNIVTPMFLSAADATKAADCIRPPSVKGALRFWWRALQWTPVRNGCDSDAEALSKLHEQECALFGAAAHERHPRRGQSRVLIRVSHATLNGTAAGATHHGFRSRAAARYLGYGLMVAAGDNRGRLEKACINAGQTFTLTLRFRGKVDDSVKNALLLWGLLGGLGKRTRRGVGSVAMQVLKEEDQVIWRAPITLDEYDAALEELLPNRLADHEPPYSAFFSAARVERLLQTDNAMDALEQFGSAMLMYRGWGYNGGRLPGGQSEQRFEDDHHWFRVGGWRGNNPGFHPKRVVFGLPHNYGEDGNEVKGETHERRASPLLFHVHRVGNDFVGVSVFLPSMFLPSGEKIDADGTVVDMNVDGWQVITGLLDGRVGCSPQAGAPLRFHGKQRIWP